MTAKQTALVPVEKIEQAVLRIRGYNVMLDQDLATIYGVTTKRLNQQVKRNRRRFPEDFVFQLTAAEVQFLRLQIATSNRGRGGRRTPPYAFTEHGAVMLASVLNTPIAVQASIQVVRAFIRLRQILATHKELARRLDDMEKKYDEKFRVVFEAIRQLMAPPAPKRPQIGFRTRRTE
jgi:phage regulator Rha-like protein